MEQIMNILDNSMLFDKKVLLKNNCDITEIDDNIKNAIQKFGIIYSNKPIYSEIYNLLKELLVINNNIISKISQVKPNKINPLKNTLILFYVNWCGYCKKFKPEWLLIKEKLKDKYNIISIDCDNKKYSEIVKYFNITGYPTVKFIGDKIYDYTGAMDAESVISEISLF